MEGFGQLFPLGARLFPPLDLIYLSSYLVEENLPVELLERLALELSREQLIDRIAAEAEATSLPALAVARTSAPTPDWDLDICREMKERTS